MKNYRLIYEQFGNPIEVLKLKFTLENTLSDNQVLIETIITPINPSDIIPITGAYSHRISLPQIAGYEGVGIVVNAGKNVKSWIGKRVLPLRGEGTWQQYIKSDIKWLIEVPDTIDNITASMAYINPLTTLLMLKKYDVQDKNIIITGVGSSLTSILLQWAIENNVKSITGIYRNPKHIPTLINRGIVPLYYKEINKKTSFIKKADFVFDSIGGTIADELLYCLSNETTFISYGLLSGRPISNFNSLAKIKYFRLRDSLPGLDETGWKKMFTEIWQHMKYTTLPEVCQYDFINYKEAIINNQKSSKSLLIFSREKF